MEVVVHQALGDSSPRLRRPSCFAIGALPNKKPKPSKTSPKPPSKGPSKWHLEQQIPQLEANIQELEQRFEEVTTQLNNPQSLSPQDIAELAKEHQQLEGNIIEAMAAWEEASLLLEEKSVT